MYSILSDNAYSKGFAASCCCRKSIGVTAALFCVFLFQGPACAAQRNLALHTELEYNPQPMYHLTADSSDPHALTDGTIDKSLWYERYREQTVGWENSPLIEIAIDLGQVYNIGNVNVHTVGGGRSYVEYPEYIIASSSRDGGNYVFSSFASSDGWDFGANLATPRILNLPIEQRARYIRLFVRPTVLYFFTDEVEVFESAGTLTDETLGQYLSKEQMIELVERARQLQRDMNVLQKRFGLSVEPDALQEMEKTISGLNQHSSLDTIDEIETAFSTFRASLLRSVYATDWLCYQAEAMDILRYGDIPAEVPVDSPISLYQWQNEYGAAVLNLVNCSNYPISFRMDLSPLIHQDKDIDSKDIFELRRALYVRVLNAGLVADPLVLQNSKPFPVAVGETVQIWLEANSKGLEPGLYTGALAVVAESEHVSKTHHVIPITLDVADKSFPSEVSFLSYNWDYVTRSDKFTRNKPEEAVADLRSHYINVSVILPDRIYGRRNAELAGQYILPSTLGRELRLYKNSRKFLLWLGMKWKRRDYFGEFKEAGGEYDTEWKNNFKILLGDLRDYMLNNGFDYDRFAIYPIDESVGDDFVYFAQIIREVDPRLKIYANKWIEPDNFNKVKDLVDIWCPHLPDALANKHVLDEYRSLGSFDEIWCYHANVPVERSFAPSNTMISKDWWGESKVFWRTMPLVATSLGMTGAGFWTYHDANRTGWLKDKMGEHGVVYDGAENPDTNCIPELIVPSKRWQQWRQGIEDAVCLTGHKDLLDEFLQKPSPQLTSEYLTTLRRRADEK